MFVRWIIEVGGLWHKSVRCEDDRLTLANSLHFHEKSSARFNRHVLDDATGQYRVHGSRLRVFQPSQNIASLDPVVNPTIQGDVQTPLVRIDACPRMTWGLRHAR